MSAVEARDQWRGYATLGVPFYLVVPHGYGVRARELAQAAGVGVAAVYQYAFVSGVFQLTT